MAPVRAGLRFLAAVCLDDLEGEVLEFGEQVAEFLRVVEQGLVFGQLSRGEPPGHGLAADLAGPFGVGAVEAGRLGVAAAAGLAAGVGADGQSAGQGEARAGELSGDPVAGRLLGLAWFHATHRLRSAGLAASTVYCCGSSRLGGSWSRQSLEWPPISGGGGRRRYLRRRRRSPGT